jgi:hypothetical protein
LWSLPAGATAGTSVDAATARTTVVKKRPAQRIAFSPFHGHHADVIHPHNRASVNAENISDRVERTKPDRQCINRTLGAEPLPTLQGSAQPGCAGRLIFA